MKSILSKPASAALNGLLLALPFMLLNAIASNRIEPFYSLFQIGAPGGLVANPIGTLALIGSLLLLPVGAFVAVWPMLHQPAGDVRRIPAINVALALIMIVLFVLIVGAFASEFYRCDILGIPNCD